MKPFTRIASAIFGFVAIAHLMRLLFNWSVVFGNEMKVTYFVIPHWVSILAFFLASLFSFMLWREAKK